MFICICERDGGNEGDEGDVDMDVGEMDSSDVVSNNIEMLREKVRLLVDDNRIECSYCNPTRFLLNVSNDERMDWENGDEGDGNGEGDGNEKTTNEDIDDNISSVEHLRNMTKSTSEKIESELENVVSKEVMRFAEHEFNEKMDILDFDWDTNKLKSHIIYKVKDINLNSIKFASFIDLLSQIYDKFVIVKPSTSDPYSEEIYLVFGNKISDNIKRNVLPINRENYIDFLYSVYSYAIYVLNLVNDIKYKTYLTKSEFIKLSPSAEYKFVVEKCKNVLIELGLINQ